VKLVRDHFRKIVYSDVFFTLILFHKLRSWNAIADGVEPTTQILSFYTGLNPRPGTRERKIIKYK
jgi:hypothetical protein